MLIDHMRFHPLLRYKWYHMNQFIRQHFCYFASPVRIGEKDKLDQFEDKNAQGGKGYNRKQKDKGNR